MIKKILFGVVIVLIIIQFVRPPRNLSGDASKDISTVYTVPENVKAIVERSCYDCHSNKTVYPWYAEVQPIGWWLSYHVTEGKRHLNLNNFASLKVAAQKKKLEDLMDEIHNDDMPLSSYTLIHKYAELSETDKQTLNAWCKQIINTIKAKYPADSLILSKQKGD